MKIVSISRGYLSEYMHLISSDEYLGIVEIKPYWKEDDETNV